MYGNKSVKSVIKKKPSKLGSRTYKVCSYVDLDSCNSLWTLLELPVSRILVIPIVGPYSPSLSWFITQSDLCIKNIVCM